MGNSAQSVKSLSTMQETRVQSLGREDPLVLNGIQFNSTDSVQSVQFSSFNGINPIQFTPFLNPRWEWQPTAVFFPGEFHGERSLVGYSPWGHEELGVTEGLTVSFILCFPLTIKECIAFVKIICISHKYFSVP